MLLASCGPQDGGSREARQQWTNGRLAPLAATARVRSNIKHFSTPYAVRHVRNLARRIGVRVRATRGEYRGARYIRREFEQKGYKTKLQRFQVDNGTSRNVVAWLPGAKRHPLVLGAHMDTVQGAPGANDNASGVAVLLDIARAVARKKQGYNLKFVAFGSEEYGSNGIHHVGSHVYVNRLRPKARRRIPGMISVDMVADGRPLIIGTAGIGPSKMARSLYRRLNRKSFNVVYRNTCDCSDNGPFEIAGAPAAFMWSGLEPDYHDPSDTVANMKKADLRRSGRAVRAFVKGVDAELLQWLRRS